MSEEVTFKNSRIIQTTLLLLLVGFLYSFIPEENLVILIFNISLSLISGGLFFLFWRATKDRSKRYFSLLSYVMINVVAIYFAIPLLRIYFLTLTFWIGVVMLIIMNTLPYVYSRKIALAVQNPMKSKLGIIYVVYLALILIFGGSAYTNALYTSHADAIVISTVSFLFSIFLFFLSPVLLIKPKEMDKLMKR